MRRLISFSLAPDGLWLQPDGAQPRQMVANRQIAHVSPTGAAAIAYPRCGRGQFVDLRSGEAHDLETPDLCAAQSLDSWSPDGARYVTQVPRENAIPGFRFFDHAGRPSGSFHEPGHYSFYPAWSPTGQQLAFLSVPLDQRYPDHPEAVFEPAIAPRLGILDMSAGTARYFSLPGLVVGTRPVWSPDGKRLAVTFGKARPSTGEMPRTVVEAQRIVAIELVSGKLQPLTEPGEPGVTLWPVAWSPGGKELAVGRRNGDSTDVSYYLLRPPGNTLVRLPGAPVWLSEEQLGNVLRQVAQGLRVSYPILSPDGRYLAYTVDTLASDRRLASDPPGDYIVVLAINAPKGAGAP